MVLKLVGGTKPRKLYAGIHQTLFWNSIAFSIFIVLLWKKYGLFSQLFSFLVSRFHLCISLKVVLTFIPNRSSCVRFKEVWFLKGNSTGTHFIKDKVVLLTKWSQMILFFTSTKVVQENSMEFVPFCTEAVLFSKDTLSTTAEKALEW